MKKTLIAMAILASSGAAMAQSNVSIYGIVDAGLNSTSASGERVTGIDSGLQSDSRIGLRGTEDLGNGLKGKFVLESGVNVDTGGFSEGNTAFGRQAWLGLEGGFGEVRLGRQHTPVRNALESIDPFALGLGGDLRRIWANNDVVERTNNTVSYSLPTVASGFSATASYAFGETQGSVSDNSGFGLGLGYNNGPLNVQLAYQTVDLAGFGVSGGDAKELLLGGTYNFGVAKAHAAVAERKVKLDAIGTDKTRNYMVGVSAPFGAHTVMASYVVNDRRSLANADSQQVALGYTYDLSKRTNVYASYARNSNDDNAIVQAGSFGQNSNTYNVGIRHKF